MLVVRAQFELVEDSEAYVKEARQHIDDWVIAAQYHGHLMGQEIPAYQDQNTICYTMLLPEVSALVEANSNDWLRDTFVDLQKFDIAPPILTLLGKDLDSEELCSCRSRRSLILFTNYATLQPPLRCGECFSPVPLYRIPGIQKEDTYELLTWEADYQACDTLQTNCATGERFAIREMSRVTSSLTQRGRAVCEEIERKTGIPVYYYLFRYRGENDQKERERRCPACDGEWYLTRPQFDRFHFRCDACRLLSNLAFCCGNGKASEVG